MTTKKESLFAAICEYEECQNVIGTFETKKQAKAATKHMSWQGCYMAGICESKVRELSYWPQFSGWFSAEAAYHMRKSLAKEAIEKWIQSPAGLKIFRGLYNMSRYGECYLDVVDEYGTISIVVRRLRKVRKPHVGRVKSDKAN